MSALSLDSFPWPAEFWWLALPGMNRRSARGRTWPDRRTADSVCAIACVARMARLSGADADRLRKLAEHAGHLRRWLSKADGDEDAWLRRYALCLLTDLVPPGTEPRYLADYADVLIYTT